MIKKLFVLLIISTALYANSLKIAVAANVSYAIQDLITTFNKTYPNTKVQMTLGSSGKLTAQIIHGAPYDLFMSANMKYPNHLYKENIAVNKPTIYAQGSLAMLSSKAQDFSKGLNILLQKNIKRIAVANPKTAPYGIATKEALNNANIYTQIKSKFIYGESIAQTVAYTVSAANIGFIAKSSLYSSKMAQFKEGTHWITLDESLYTPINQGMVILKKGKNKTVAKAFYDFLLSNKAQQIFKAYGYHTL